MENFQIDPARLPELFEALSQLSISLDLNEVIDRALPAAIKLTRGERAFLQFPDHTLVAFPKLTAETAQTVETALEELVRTVTQNRPATSIADTQNDPRFVTEPLAALFTGRALLIVPLQARGEFLGALLVDRKASTGSFTADDRAALTFFVGWAALAIRSAQSPRREAAFMSEVAHELAHPLTSIKGYADLLLKELIGPLNAKQVEFLETISLSTNQMRDLLNKLLDIGRLETRRLRLEIEPIDVREYTKQVVGHSRPDILKKRLTITLPVDPVPLVQADLQRLVQVVTLLLDNAIKYTPAGGKIDISAEVLGSLAKIVIHDTGIGIAPHDHARIFQKWFRSAEPLVREYPGDGLSLYIAKHLIELMGGAIGFESEPGQGSTFWFTLPVAEQDSSANS
jgi:signal transduction histidine kinase